MQYSDVRHLLTKNYAEKAHSKEEEEENPHGYYITFSECVLLKKL